MRSVKCKIYDFKTRQERTPAHAASMTSLQTKTALVLDLLINEIRHNELKPDKVMVLIGTRDDHPDHTWRYLQFDFSEKELRAAMEQIYQDMRGRKR